MLTFSHSKASSKSCEENWVLSCPHINFHSCCKSGLLLPPICKDGVAVGGIVGLFRMNMNVSCQYL